MSLPSNDDAILDRLSRNVRVYYGARLERVVLFGSRARGDHRADSDYDVAVFVRDFTTLWNELQPLGAITTDILMQTGAVVSAKPFRAGSYSDDRPLMRAIARDGRDL